MTEVKKTPLSKEFIEFVSNKTGIATGIVEEMCAHNVLTLNQVANLTGKTMSAINQLIRPRIKSGETYTVLTPVYPFPEINEMGERESGRVFVAKDEKFFDYVKKQLSW